MNYENYNSETESIVMGKVGDLINKDAWDNISEDGKEEIRQERKRAKSFSKFFERDCARALKQTSSNHMKVFAFILENICFTGNELFTTYDEICKETGLSRPTIAKIMKEFQECGIIVQKHTFYMVNPNIIARGFEGFRMRLVGEFADAVVEHKAKKRNKKTD